MKNSKQKKNQMKKNKHELPRHYRWVVSETN